MDRLRYTLTQLYLLPFAFVMSHSAIMIWKIFHPSYIRVSRWISDNLYEPYLHVAFVNIVVGLLNILGTYGQGAAVAFRTYLENNPPTYHDADKVYYAFLTPLFGLLIYILSLPFRRR